MPAVLKKELPGGWFVLWRITETESELARRVTPADLHDCATIASPQRRMQRMAWRAALRGQMPDARVAYGLTGAPVTGEGFLGVSHCRGYAAVMWCDRPCAIDIEQASRDFSRASSRYISPAEAALPAAGEPVFMAALWCAKEALYKLSGRRELDFRDDIRITAADPGAGRLSGRIADGPETPLRMFTHDDILVVYTDQAPLLR